MKIIAHYLPQFHPFPENDEWWGKGFTEWTNVGKAKPLFKGHYQPKVPADLGYYDLRLEEVRTQQAELAREAGVDAFCYWHYWFGNGKRLLQMPFEEVLKTGRPDFPFCLGWANHSWYEKNWSNSKWYSKQLLIEQTYPSKEDIDLHFYSLLDAFSDHRYLRVDQKPLFLIYDVYSIPDLNLYIRRWQELARQNGLVGLFIVALAYNLAQVKEMKHKEVDAITLSLHHVPFGGTQTSIFSRIKRYSRALILKMPNIVDYADAIDRFYDPIMNQENIFPTLIPNFDHTPRSGNLGEMYHNSTPEKFAEHARKIMEQVRLKDPERQIIFLKSWNEWGEGNYMEPDLKWGKAYIKALAKEKDKIMGSSQSIVKKKE